MMQTPLAEKLRPKTLEEVVGQRHILALGKPLYNIYASGFVPNLIFYGPPGVGKTTVARLLAEKTSMTLRRLNGTSASTADIREIAAEVGTFSAAKGILLYLDEIQYFNKKQQQLLLEYMENGEITLIAATTENPYFSVYSALLSRATIFEFRSVEPEEMEKAITRAFRVVAAAKGVSIELEKDVVSCIAYGTGGDARKAINTVELLTQTTVGKDKLVITKEEAQEVTQRSAMRCDRDGDEHYDLLSALQKSIRGSDENAALYYAGRLLEAGALLSVCRRLLVIASEDIGLAYPTAASITRACVDNALTLGMPEARIPIAEAIVLLATAPKSNSAYLAMDAALEDVKKYGALAFPRHLQNQHCDGAGAAESGQNYRYPHDFPHHYVRQQYLPDTIREHVYYEFGENRQEQAAKQYREKIVTEDQT